MTVLKRSLGNQLQFCHECLCGALAACSDAFAGVGMVWSAMDWNYVDTTQSCKVKKGYWSLGHILISYPWSTRSCKLKGSPCIISTTPSYSTRQVAIQSGSVESGNINRKLYWLVSSHVMRCWYRRWKKPGTFAPWRRADVISYSAAFWLQLDQCGWWISWINFNNPVQHTTRVVGARSTTAVLRTSTNCIFLCCLFYFCGGWGGGRGMLTFLELAHTTHATLSHAHALHAL